MEERGLQLPGDAIVEDGSDMEDEEEEEEEEEEDGEKRDEREESEDEDEDEDEGDSVEKGMRPPFIQEID